MNIKEWTSKNVNHDTFRANGTTYKRTYEGAAEVCKEE